LYCYTASAHIHDEIPAHSTMYRARPDDERAVRRQVRRDRAINHLRDWLPPVFFRALRRARGGAR
jgi:hypothetical protein